MKKGFYGKIIASIVIAVIAVLLGYFVESLMAVLGLLISLSTVVTSIATVYMEESFMEEEEDAVTYTEV